MGCVPNFRPKSNIENHKNKLSYIEYEWTVKMVAVAKADAHTYLSKALRITYAIFFTPSNIRHLVAYSGRNSWPSTLINTISDLRSVSFALFFMFAIQRSKREFVMKANWCRRCRRKTANSDTSSRVRLRYKLVCG